MTSFTFRLNDNDYLKIKINTMKVRSRSILGCAGSALVTIPAMGAGEKPNVVYIIMDDLGYGDLGCFGQEKIETPNIGDALGCPSRTGHPGCT